MHVYMYIYIYIYIYIHTHIHIHVYIYIYMYIYGVGLHLARAAVETGNWRLQTETCLVYWLFICVSLVTVVGLSFCVDIPENTETPQILSPWKILAGKILAESVAVAQEGASEGGRARAVDVYCICIYNMIYIYIYMYISLSLYIYIYVVICIYICS